MIEHYIKVFKNTLDCVNKTDIELVVEFIKTVQEDNARLFILGVGGSAANASHAVNDFRKICNIETYTPTDNVSELTARINDDGWESSYVNWLKVSKFNCDDILLILSVGGGSKEFNVSMNLVHAIDYAQKVRACVVGIVGKTGGYTADYADASVIIPVSDPELITPVTEAMQSVILHLIVSHPSLKVNQTKW